jgi:hypothetical protein
MSARSNPPGGWLGRWSRVKHEAAREKSVATEAPRAEVDASPPAATPETIAAAAIAPPDAIREDALPPVESLTIDSDYSAFLKPEVGEALKRQALKQLFRDPRFNVMDGLDVYIDDYSKPDPIDPDVVRQMVQGRYIFDPPQTRVNAKGFVEDVPPEEPVPPQAAAAPEALPSDLSSEPDAVASIPAAGEESPPVPASAAPSEADRDPAPSHPPIDPTSSAR